MKPTPLSPDPTPARRKGVRRISTCAAFWVASIAWGTAPLGADEPITLGNAQIGLTAEAIAGPDPAEDAPVESEWRAGSPGAESDALVPVVPAPGPVVSTYAACVELAVQAGNPFSAASGVCQAIFPEEPAGAAESASALPSLDETPADEPIVLRLHGAPPTAEPAAGDALDAGAGGDASGEADPWETGGSDATSQGQAAPSDAGRSDAPDAARGSGPDATARSVRPDTEG